MQAIIAYGEIGTKSRSVQQRMIKRLRNRVSEKLAHLDIEHTLTREQGRLLVETTEDEMPDAVHALERLPGVTWVAPFLEADLDMDDIEDTALEAIEGAEADSFAVAARRAGDHELGSDDIEEAVGAAIAEETGWSVDLDDPDLTVWVEARRETAFVFTAKIEGVGGLPINRQNPVVTLLQDRVDAYAAFMLMKRGCSVTPIYPGSNTEDVEEGVHALQQFDPKLKLATFRNEDPLDALRSAFKALGAKAAGCGVTADELDDLDPSEYPEPLLKPVAGMTEDEVIEAYADILAVPY